MDLGKPEEKIREEEQGEKKREQLVEAGKGGAKAVRMGEQFFERLMTVEDLADAFGFAPQTVRNWVSLRQIPFISLGGKTRFRRRSVEAWLERKEFRSCR